MTIGSEENTNFDDFVGRVQDFTDPKLLVSLELICVCLRCKWSFYKALDECDCLVFFTNEENSHFLYNDFKPSDAECLKLIALLCKLIAKNRGITEDKVFNIWLSSH